VNATREDLRLADERLLSQLREGNVKSAADTLTDYTRIRLREEQITEKVIPAITITDDQLDQNLIDEKPIYIGYLEPESPGALSMPFGTFPGEFYLNVRKYPVHFHRVVTRRATKDVDELRSSKGRIDLRQVVADNIVKDMHREIDTKFFAVVRQWLRGPGQTVAWSGATQWVELSGGVTRETWCESLKVMQRGYSKLAPVMAVTNSLFVFDIMKWGRDEAGGDVSQQLLLQGFTQDTFEKMPIVGTIKHDLIPENRVFQFANPEYLGKNLVLEQPVMYVDKKAFMMEFMFYMTSGLTIAHPGGLAAVDFVG
jgi:hypothetical protein